MSAHREPTAYEDTGLTAQTYLMEQLPALLQLLQGSDVRELELQEGDVQVRLHRARALNGGIAEGEAAEPEADIAVGPITTVIRAPIVGTFYRAGQPGMPPLAAEGSQVTSGTVVGIIETLHELTDVESGREGVVTKVLATDGQPVEYGQALFEVTSDELGTES